jgi:hypothetical protein
MIFNIATTCNFIGPEPNQLGVRGMTMNRYARVHSRTERTILWMVSLAQNVESIQLRGDADDMKKNVLGERKLNGIS